MNILKRAWKALTQRTDNRSHYDIETGTWRRPDPEPKPPTLPPVKKPPGSLRVKGIGFS
jgi:hypothetical protein